MSRDFVEFINSKDVKKYVRETGYQLSSQEAAFVVWQSKDTPLEGALRRLGRDHRNHAGQFLCGLWKLQL